MQHNPSMKIPLAASFALHAALFAPGLFPNDNEPAAPTTQTQQTTQTPETDAPLIDNLSIAEIIRLQAMSTASIQPVVKLETEIKKDTTDQFINDFKAAQSASATPFNSLITVEIDSVGGLVASGYEIMDTISQSPIPVRIVCEKQAASMAAILLITTPNVIAREAKSDCSIMIHAPYITLKDKDFSHTLKHEEYKYIETQLNSGKPITHFEFTNDADGKSDKFAKPNTKRYDVNTVKAYLEDHNNLTSKFIDSIADHSDLSREDVTYAINQGDIYFSPIEAKYLKLIDYIDGVVMDDLNTQIAKSGICSKLPGLKLCSPTSTANIINVTIVQATPNAPDF